MNLLKFLSSNFHKAHHNPSEYNLLQQYQEIYLYYLSLALIN